MEDMAHALLETLTERTFSVPEYLDLVNELIAPLKVSVEGEVTDLKILREWVFFSLKDADTGSLLRCGLHAQGYRRLGVSVEEGMQVKVLGYGKLSPKTGNFGFWVSHIEPLGEGALRRAYELLLAKLKEEGLFARKRALPVCVRHIGVISSRDGVVLQDLRNNLPALGIRIDFVHSSVEGAASALSLTKAIEYFCQNKNPPELLILIRGGGSLESLQGFNNETVVRALFAAPMPVLVGIGHDVDAPIATFVADVSASTPTAVAHVIAGSWAPLTDQVPQLTNTILSFFRLGLQRTEHRAALALRSIQSALSAVLGRFRRYDDLLASVRRSLPRRIQELRAKSDDVYRRVRLHYTGRLQRALVVSMDYERLLAAHDPVRALARGYSIVRGPRGLVRHAKDVRVGDQLSTTVSDGTITSQVVSTI